jgi:TolB-like protein
MNIAALFLATVVVLPFDNFSGDDAAAQNIAALMSKAIAARGWTVVGSAAIEPLLENERVRYLDSLQPAMLKTLSESTRANAVVSGTIYIVSAGRNPVVALSARMVRADGTLVWGDVVGLSADETEQMLGLGRKSTAEGVAADAVNALMRRFPDVGVRRQSRRFESGADAPHSEIPPGKRKPLFHAGPLSFRVKDAGAQRRVCVLPFENTGGAPAESARIIADIVALRLAAGSAYEVVEPSALRAAALQASIASFREATTDDLARLAPVVGTPLFLRGTIYTYADSTVHLELSLVDVAARKVLWTAQHARQGSDYAGLFMRGATTNAVALADRVITEIAATSEGNHR